MSPDTKSQIKSASATTAVVGAALFAGWLMIPQPPKKAYLQWDMGGAGGVTATVTDVWFKTNLSDPHWMLIGSVTNTNVFRMPKIGDRGFFNVSHRVNADGTMQ